LHAAIVDAIERLYAGRLQEQIERVAHHAARSGVSFKAVRYLREAGVKAAGGSAVRAAIAYFEEALTILAELPRSTETLTEALEIRIELGPALINTKGPTSIEVEGVYRGALELVDELGLDTRRFTAQWGLWYVDYTRGNYEPALESGVLLLDTARKSNDPGQLLEAHHSVWPTLFAVGRVKDAVAHMEAGCALYDPQRDGKHAFMYAGHDPGVCARYHLGVTRWILGYPDQGLAEAEQAAIAAEKLDHPMTTVIAMWFTGWLKYQRGDRAGALASLESLMALGTLHEFVPWTITAQAFVQVLSQARVEVETIAVLQQPAASAQHITSWRRTLYMCALAELCVNSGHADAGLRVLGAIDAKGRDSLGATEMLRLEGELRALKSAAPINEILACFQAAIELARERGQKSFELRAAISLARFLDQQGRRAEARAALADIYGFFTEGHATADLKTAKLLLASLT
jgi:tetratricopeptide (TPR) repeat protein